MENEVHVDEKWFFVCCDGESHAPASDEIPPERAVKHKSHIAKVMFLCAQARPRKLTNNTWWDGKIGIWPIGHCRRAERGSVNRPRGTLLFEPETTDMDKHRSMMIGDVLPAILNEFPHIECNRFAKIIMQQDGAPAHVNPGDHERMETLTEMGLDEKTRLVTQPANSPDLNVNDLGFFNALQSMCHCTTPSNELELVEMAEQTCQDHLCNKINRVWVTLQTAFNNVLDNFGGNQHKMTPMGKEKLEKQGRLPRVVEVNPIVR